MTPPVRYREASVADVPGVLALHRTVLAEGRWFVTAASEYRETLDTLRQRIAAFARSPNSLWLVAIDRPGAVVGFCTLTGGALARTRHVARLEVMVHPLRRGEGIGGTLVREAVAWARDNPMLTKLSLAVFDDNTRAIALYEALGFVEEGRRVGEYREPDGTLRGDRLMALPVPGPAHGPGETP